MRRSSLLVLLASALVASALQAAPAAAQSSGWQPGPGPGAVAPVAPAPVAGAAPQLTIDSPTAKQNVSTKSDFTTSGTATDPGFGPSGIDDVQVFINGERGGAYSTALGGAVLESNGSWSLTFTPTHFPSMHSYLFV